MIPQKTFKRKNPRWIFFYFKTFSDTNLGILLIAEVDLDAYNQNWKVPNNFLCINNIIFKLIWAKTIYITFFGTKKE